MSLESRRAAWRKFLADHLEATDFERAIARSIICPWPLPSEVLLTMYDVRDIKNYAEEKTHADRPAPEGD
jgi:hypothetical protein